MIEPKEIELPAVAPPVENVAWRELFKYPRSIVAGCLIGLTQTGGVGFVLWQVTLFVMLLAIAVPIPNGGFDNRTTGSSKRSRYSLQPGMTPVPITFLRPQNRGAVIQAWPADS